MGTRADFYLGQGIAARWLGSIAFDGYPDGIVPCTRERQILFPESPHITTKIFTEWPAGQHLFGATTADEYRERLRRFFQYRDDVSSTDHGWPWPWDDSTTTDFSYTFFDGKVWACCFGYAPWQEAATWQDTDEQSQEKLLFPNMAAYKNVRFDRGSGLLIVSIPTP